MIDATRGQSVLLCVTWRIIRMKHEKIPLILDPEWNRKTCNVRDKCFPHLIYFKIFFEKCASVHITFFSVHICIKQQNWAAVLSPKKHTTHKILIKEKTNLAHLSTRKYISFQADADDDDDDAHNNTRDSKIGVYSNLKFAT